MRANFILSLFLSLLLIGAVKGAEEEKAEFISLDFKNVDINLVIKFISELTGTNFIVDPRVRAQVTVICPTKIPVESVYEVFKSILEMHGFSLVQAGKMVKVVSSVEAKQKAVRTETGKEIKKVSPEDVVVTQMVPLEYADVNQVRTILTPLVSKASNMVGHLPTNTLIVTETSSNIQRLLKIVKEIDVEGVRMEREVIPLKFASASVLASTLTQSLEERRQPGQKVPEKVLKVIAEDRTNCLIVVASSEDMKKIKELIGKLDKETPATLSKVNVYYLENADSEELAKVLASLQTQQPARRVPTKGVPTPEIKPSIVADKDTNALIITASPEDHVMFRGIIDKLDIMRKQVLVEMLIAEVSMDITRQLGVELATLDDAVERELRGTAWTDFSDAISEAGSGFSGLVVGLMKGTTSEGISKMGAILQAYEKDIDFNILATPHIFTSDNEEAEIKIGEKIPYVKQSRVTETNAETPTVIKTYDYKDVGVELKITPHISQKRFVRLDIFGRISKLIGTLTDTPSTIEREARTVVTVEDGNTVVIGGLTRDDKDKTLHKVPFFGDIPVLGWLFKRTSEETVKRNLLIFITPYVIGSVEEAEAMARGKELEQEKFIQEQEKLGGEKISW